MFPFSIRRTWLGALAVAAASAGSASAQTFADIQFWVGNGSNQAAFVVDWNDGLNPQSLMWGYRWDGDATGEDMLHAIVTADTRLFAHVSDPFGGGLGTALFGVGYDLNNNGAFGVMPPLDFDAGGYSVGGPEDGRAATDAGDHWEEGWFSDGFWSYWLSDGSASPTWGFSGVGMSSRVLADGSWDGWSYAPGFDGSEPSFPVAAEVPAPSSLALGAMSGLLAFRRRKRTAVALALGAVATAANAQYQCNPNDFAVEVVSSTGLPATALYNDPAAVIGRPTLRFNNGTINNPDFRRAKLIEPPFNTGTSNERLITTLNSGQSVTVRMGRTVFDDPNNPYGVDLNVFGNAFFSVTSGGFVSDATNLNTTTIGGVFSESVRVSVSPDNVNWYTYSGRTGDGLFPTNSYRWNRGAAAWTEIESNPTLPINPAHSSTNFPGMTAADILDLYGASAGGTGFDLAESGFAFINYVRFDGVAGFSGGEIDAVAAVRPIPAPATGLVVGAGGVAATRRRR